MVSVQIKPVSQEARSPTKKVTIDDHFAGKKVSLKKKPPLEQLDSTAGPSGVKVKSKTQEEKEVESIYKDISTEESDSDVPLSRLPPKLKNLKVRSTYVIYTYEGAHFPGIVETIDKKNSVVNVNTMTKGSLTTWTWPEVVDLHECNLEDIVEVIPTPTLINRRGKDYFIPKMKKYGW